jgi:manganese/zinc/iron transport system permease protein
MMISSWTYFFTDEVAIKVLIGTGVIGLMTGAIGVFSFLRKKTLVADAISHAVLPGVCLGFMFAQEKDPFALMLGAIIFGWLSVWLIELISTKSKLSEDAAIAIVSTFFFAIGSVLLSMISKSGNTEQSGLKSFLFGNAATMNNFDVQLFIIASIVVIGLIIVLFHPLKIVAFDPSFAQVKGIKVGFLTVLLSVLTVLTVAIGIQAVGVVLMSALLIAPAATARYWTNRLAKMIVLASLIGGFSGVFGVIFSTVGSDMPTGPWIVTTLFLFTITTLLFAPKKGWLSIRSINKQNRLKMMRENTLKLFYQLKEQGNNKISIIQLLEKRPVDTSQLEMILRLLIKEKLLIKIDNSYRLTEEGILEGRRVVRLHRLWELYLTKRMNFKEDHIHGTAETIEHMITPEIEAELLKELDFPNEDPHNKSIPY